MSEISAKKRIWGWFFFDWASQPYNTLLITFIFAPYIAELIGDGVQAQAAWGFGIGAAGVVIAILAPILGAIADSSGNRMNWIRLFSVMYLIGAFGIWWTSPENFNLVFSLVLFAVGMIGMELATIFTNSILPELGTKEEIGKISGSGWAFGYVGGLVALIIMLAFFAEDAATGKTMIGMDPLFGLDASAREGTRFVGPLTAVWFLVSMVPFFLWVREPKRAPPPKGAFKVAIKGLVKTIKKLPQTPSLFAYLGSSMFYRDALNGMYAFGGLYAATVLGWSTPEVGVFGILAITSGAIFAWFGGRIDSRIGPMPVIKFCIWVLIFVSVSIVFISRTSVYGMPVADGSNLPDIMFYGMGILIGAAGGVIQAASRTMMVRQANPDRMTEAFGLYGLAGKATSFIAPFAVGIVTVVSGSQQIGIVPLIVLLLIGLVMLRYVNPEGEAHKWDET